MIRKFFLLLMIAEIAYCAYLSTLDLKDVPELQNGDLIFQTTQTNQSMAIGLATGSLYIHTGILKNTPQGWMVIHAQQQVSITPLEEWVNSGVLKRFAIYRDTSLTPGQAARIVGQAERYVGVPYDYYFSFTNNTIYCSELIYLAYRNVDLPIGKIEKIGSLYVNNRFVKQLIEQRWEQYPACQGQNMTFDQCYDVIMGQELISPTSIAHDPKMVRIFSNYP